MPVKKILGKIVLPLLTIASFSCGIIVPIYEDYFHDQSRETSLFLNGEILGKRYSQTDAYKDYCIEDDGMKIIERLLEGETVLIYTAVGDCPSCLKTEPKLCELLSYVPFETYLLHADYLADTSSLHEAYTRITASFPKIGQFENSVPKAYLVSPNEQMVTLKPASNSTETGDLAKYMGEFFRINNVVRFEKEEGFASFLKKEETVGYVYSSSLEEFRSKELPTLEKANKKVGLFKSELLEEGYYTMGEALTRLSTEKAYSLLSL